MKILFITHFFYPHIGGIEVNSEILANEFSKAGEDVRLVTWTSETGDKKFTYPVIRQPSVLELLRQHQWADVVFENNPSLKLSWPALLLGKKTVVAIRTWISRNDGSVSGQDKLKFMWLKRASGVIAVSEEIRKVTWPAAKVIGNPYRDNFFKKDSAVNREFEFAFLGRLVSDKGADMAIDALHRLIELGEQYNKVILTIIGDGPEKESLEKRAVELNLADNVRFIGALSGAELVAMLNKHRILLVPSRWKEPFGNVALEGMACGCVPIVADGGGLPDAVGNAGLVFQRGDIDAMVSCMHKVISEPELETELRLKAESHLQAHKPGVVANRYLQIIKSTKK